MPFKQLAQFFSAYQARAKNPADKVRAAVLCPLFIENDCIRILFIKRSQMVRAHRGEISFPGGVKESKDPSLVQTCLRETEEEIGIRPAEITLLGALDEVNTTTGFLISPYVGIIPPPHRLTLSRNEVESVIIAPVQDFYKPENLIEFYFFNGRGLQAMTAYRHRDQVIWGATAKVLSRLLELGREHGLFTAAPKSSFHLAS